MNQAGRKLFTALGIALTLGLTSNGLARAQEGQARQHQPGREHKHGDPLHHGKVTMTREYHFETVFARDGLKVYPRTHGDQPINASRLTGTATFYHPKSPDPWFTRKLTPTAARPGQAATSLDLKLDLSKVPADGAKVAFRVEGLPKPGEPTATFTVPFALAASNEITVTQAARADQKAIAAAKVCPVSKEDLHSMGGPLKVSRGNRSIFICCKGCLEKIQADPDKYFGAAAAQ
ncbi:MAG: hypothetical protein ACYC61_23985 [Isosphaeraceae bacterium]